MIKQNKRPSKLFDKRIIHGQGKQKSHKNSKSK